MRWHRGCHLESMKSNRKSDMSVMHILLAGVCIFIREDTTMEGPQVPSEAWRHEAPRGVGSGEGRHSPSPIWGSEGIAPRKFSKNQCWNCTFSFGFTVILLVLATSGVWHQLQSSRLSVIQGLKFFSPMSPTGYAPAYLNYIPAKFHPDRMWNKAYAFLKSVAQRRRIKANSRYSKPLNVT